MSFCVLDKDEKTFEYFKAYVEFLEKNNQTCMILDNEIQAREIQEHLLRNGIGRGNHSEVIAWIRSNAKPFRDYLNTIKLIYVIWYCMGRSWIDISFEEVNELQDKLNTLKGRCLDTIF